MPVAEGLGARARAGGRGAGVPVAEGLGAWGRGAGCQAAYPVQGPVSHPDPWLVQMSWPWLGQQLVRMPVGPLVVLVVGGGAAQPRAEGRARWGGGWYGLDLCALDPLQVHLSFPLGHHQHVEAVCLAHLDVSGCMCCVCVGGGGVVRLDGLSNLDEGVCVFVGGCIHLY